MTAASEVVRRIGVLTVLRWLDRGLPAGLDDLIAEAERAGYGWIAGFRDEWPVHPCLGDGEGLFVVTDRTIPVAMAAIGTNRRADAPPAGRLKHIYVGQGLRGRGLLRPLVELCLARAGSRWPVVTLHTDNPVAARVYESYGFRPTAAHGWSTHVRDMLRDMAYPAAAAGSGTP